jgi:hypothetical protein
VNEPQRYFFLHMLKTAGTALFHRVRNHFGERAVYPMPEDEGRPGATREIPLLLDRFAARRNEIRVVAGHFPLCTVDLLGVPFSTFTVLRDPVERTLSYLRHQQKLSPEVGSWTLEEIYAEPARLHGFIHNHMVKMLSLSADEMTTGVATMVPFDDHRLERAERNLADRIDIFGFQEHFDEFCERLAARFDWDLGAPRSGNRTESADVSDEFRERIAHDNRLDVELYSFARRLLERGDTAATG